MAETLITPIVMELTDRYREVVSSGCICGNPVCTGTCGDG